MTSEPGQFPHHFGHHHEPQNTTVYTQTNLVSDGSVAATTISSNLINPWGISHSPTGPFWVSDNGTGLATIYDGAGNPIQVAGQDAITIAAPTGVDTAAPTGQVFNIAGSGFDITANGMTAPSVFLFATEDGTISGWAPTVDPKSSVIAVDNSNGGNGAVYKGLAIGTTGQGTFLYAANFGNGTVDVFDSNFKQVNSFTDPNLPPGYAPFNVQVLDNKLYVSFALQNAAKHDDVAGPGHGFVDAFDLNGNMLDRLASRGVLNSPWGLDIAPKGFGQFSGDLLVGNFGDGTIDAFDPKTDKFLGQLLGSDGNPLQIQDLWALTNGTGSQGTNPSAVYFTAGGQDEQHGLFGSLAATGDLSQSSSTMSAYMHP
ncbi:MAG TPA: TIGR03118 family protein [Rhodopila sp.]|nr:TIGR03118 family protein [Rhodopila sp.]